jgi:pyruvate formate lyase activating enzyme
MSKALVFSVEEFSVFDGPGIRTAVFLMGCPLRCEWCHNPEGQVFSNSIVRSPNGCIGCGSCLRTAVTVDGVTRYTEQGMKQCPNNLLRYCAKEYTAEELCASLEKNIAILNASGGGVTFSGGEPTASPDFLLECLSRLEGKTNRAVQTCGFCSTAVFAQVLANCDYMLFDIKLVDEQLHKRYTGVSNALILENFRTLAASGKPCVIRTPLIPTVTDTEENIRAIAKLLSENGVRYIELLPYNKMAGSKYRLAGREYVPSFDESIPVAVRTDLFSAYGIEAKKI